MIKKYRFLNIIGIIIGLIFIWIGYNARRQGIGPLEVLMPPSRNSLPFIENQKSYQDPFRFGVILIILNIGVMVYRFVNKKK